jgi:hypothetical protein
MPLPSLPPMGILGRGVLASLGLLSFGGGCAAVFTTQNGPGAAAMITIGAALLVLSLIINNLNAFELGGAKFQFKLAAVEAKFAQANELEQGGNPSAAESLRDEAETLLEEAATEYLALRRGMLPGRERTAALEDVLARARELSRRPFVDKEFASRWLSDGPEAHRIVALALMHENSGLRSLDPILNAASNPRSAFEQYHALKLLEAMVDECDDQVAPATERIVAALRRAGSLRFQPDQTRYKIRNRILTKIEKRTNLTRHI